MKNKNIFLTIILIFAVVSVSYHAPEKIIQNEFKPAKTFEWLTDLKMLSQCLSIDHFEKTKGRSFDSAGVYMADGKYHPVNVFQYGIFCFDTYRQSGNEEYKRKCINQFKYFLDSTKYTVKEDGSIGFPYLITFRDLKPTWYSGLAQAEGIMYLIRYYYLTKDSRALDYIQRVKAFLLIPVEKGGTLNTLSNDEAWIEEYPNSKSKPEVINGFVTSIMALREYTFLFPGDSSIKALLAKCIYAHKKEFYKYDLGNGILYDLGEKQVVGPWYGKFQVVQMKQMFELFRDTFYKNIEMLWASYSYNKPVPGMTGCLLTDTNYSSPAKTSDGWLEPASNIKDLVGKENISNITVADKMNAAGINNLFDRVLQTTFMMKNQDSIEQPPHIAVALNNKISTSSLYIRPLSDTLDYTGFKIYFKPEDRSDWKEMKISSIVKQDFRYYFSFKETKIKQFKIEFNLLSKKTGTSFAEINLVNSNMNYITHFSHYISNDYALTDSISDFKIAKKDVDDFVMFYKTGNSSQEVDKNKWKVYEGIRAAKFTIHSKEKYCRFIVIFKNNSSSSRMSLIKPI